MEEWHERKNKRSEQSSKNKSATGQDCDSLSHLLTFYFSLHVFHFSLLYHLDSFIALCSPNVFETRKKQHFNTWRKWVVLAIQELPTWCTGVCLDIYMFANVFWMVVRWLLNIPNYMILPTSMLHDILIYSNPSLNVSLWPILLHVITTSSAVWCMEIVKYSSTK